MLRGAPVSLCRPSHTRAYADLLTVRNKPIISSGPAGRSAVTGHVATVFGCTGFLGRYVVAKLAKRGTQVVVPYRDENTKRHLRPMGDLGQIVPLELDIRNHEQIAECVRHSDIVYNLIGRDYETKNFDFHSVNVTGAEAIAGISADCGVPRLVHVSHISANHKSSSEFYKTKAEGEDAVRAAFPDAIVVRPSEMYGIEDRLLNSFAAWPMLWKFNKGGSTMNPVHVQDVAQALANISRLPELDGETLNLPGPITFSHKELEQLVSLFTFHPVSTFPEVPKNLALMISRLAQKAWWPMLSPDGIERRFISEPTVEELSGGDWDKVGVTPAEIEEVAIAVLRRYRSGRNYVRPVVLPNAPKRTSHYHITE
ncbi:hypothetical protein M408DRAFT_328984 [Serendipita vermifera MAFF 305830]|uniref:NAD-dependent epimerase/dehydratase domain-containing protein n=1 Tax=Serendipita vermifera MAFF 305830 TaxID=933852 RepID=A0A0C2WRX5_SERVB|nr:hypothetical protein M408DRAFT_328984 [Serendipita vermifera MAFF 305830]